MKNKPLVFIIEDAQEMANLIKMYLEKSEIDSKIFDNAEDASKALEQEIPELFVLDLNLPGMSGFDFLQNFRKKYFPTVPVIIVSARDADDDIIKGLEIGADEFVTKPFSPSVLVARIQACLRRVAETISAAEETLSFSDYTLLLNSCVLKKGSIKIPLSVKEYAVLEYLVKNANQVMSPEKIYQEVWKTPYGDITAVAVYVQRLRRKIEKDPANPEFLKTIFGKGYLFKKDEAE